MTVHFVGHPLIDAMEGLPGADPEGFRRRNGLDPHKPIIALLPGSRAQEIDHILSVMLEVVPHFPQYQFAVAGAPSLDAAFYEPYLKSSGVPRVADQTYALLQNAHAALVTSGTATLETALLNVPQVVCYKGSQISYQIARRLIKLKYISLVNLIMDQAVVPELIQHDLNRKNLLQGLGAILEGPGRAAQLEAYARLRQKLGGAGASTQAARLIVGFSKPR